MSTMRNGQRQNRSAARLAWAATCLVVVQTIGCSRYVEDKWSRARPATHRAGGVVEYQGKPLSRATVTFVARDESRGKELSAVGFTDDRGHFQLKTFRPGDGAIAGSHRVMVEKQSLADGQSDNERPTASREEYEAQRAAAAVRPKLVRVLPGKYSSFDTSGLTADVTEKGPNEFVFRLDDSGPERK
jgi:hypothetical protein